MKPRIWMYARGFGELSSAEKDVVARAELIVSGGLRPEIIRDLRQRARGRPLRFLYEDQPQWVPPETRDHDLHDEVFDPKKAFFGACKRNPQWFLYDTSGRIIHDAANGYARINWTPACPVGTEGEAAGLRASQFYIRKLAQIANQVTAWGGPWDWNDLETVNGFDFEILYDCLGTIDPNHELVNADPDRDGQPEGVTRRCSDGGIQEPLSQLMRQENNEFFQALRARFPQTFFWWINDNTKWSGPSWRRYCNGVKLENWNDDRLGRPNPRTWESYMFGTDPDFPPQDFPSYLQADRYTCEGRYSGRTPHGTRVTAICIAINPRAGEAENNRRVRFGIGSSLLAPLPGPVRVTADEWHPYWHPLFDLELGEPTSSALEKISYGTHGSLYRRYFRTCTVTVNPGIEQIADYPAMDAVFERR